MMRPATFGPRWHTLLPAFMAVVALAAWSSGSRVTLATAGFDRAAIALDGEVAAGSLAERTARTRAAERDSTGGSGGSSSSGRPARRGEALHSGDAPAIALLLTAPDGTARRSLERAGRSGAPTTAPPPTS